MVAAMGIKDFSMQRSNLNMTGRCRNLSEIAKDHAMHELHQKLAGFLS
jgi:hypothetical protein